MTKIRLNSIKQAQPGDIIIYDPGFTDPELVFKTIRSMVIAVYETSLLELYDDGTLGTLTDYANVLQGHFLEYP